MGEETSTYSWSRFCTAFFWPTANKYQLSHLNQNANPDLREKYGTKPLKIKSVQENSPFFKFFCKLAINFV